MKRKKIPFLLILCLWGVVGVAQDVPTYVRTLADRGVEVSMDPTVARAVMNYVPAPKVAGYRLCLFSDNGQTARGAAAGALGALSSVAPDVQGEMIYSNPFFRVYAGHCLTKTEAAVLLGRLKYSFPKAYIVGYSGVATEFSRPMSSVGDSTLVGR